MIYWVIFHILFFCSLVVSVKSKDISIRRFFKFITIFLLFYFSAFRDGLGVDYNNYIEKLSWPVDFSQNSMLVMAEPVFALIAYLVQTTHLSEVFFFAVCAFVTNVVIADYYYKDKRYVIQALCIYLFFTMLYYTSFNLCRQYFATGLFFFALRYVDKKNIWLWTVCILIAMGMHTSAIFLWPFYFILNRRLSLKVLIIISLIAFSLIGTLGSFIGAYVLYLDTDEKIGASGFVILYNIILFILFINKKARGSVTTQEFNLMFFMTLFSDLSFFVFYFFRFTIYFIPVIGLVIPRVLDSFSPKLKLSPLFCFALFILFYFILIQNSSNPLYIPSKILPISSLFDT